VAQWGQAQTLGDVTNGSIAHGQRMEENRIMQEQQEQEVNDKERPELAWEKAETWEEKARAGMNAQRLAASVRKHETRQHGDQ
jgi:hypothetical protein